MPDRKAAAHAAIRYVQLVYGSQLQRPADEEAFDDPLDVASMKIEQRNRLKRRLLAQHPELVEEYRALAAGRSVAETIVSAIRSGSRAERAHRAAPQIA